MGDTEKEEKTLQGSGADEKRQVSQRNFRRCR